VLAKKIPKIESQPHKHKKKERRKWGEKITIAKIDFYMKKSENR